MPRLHTILASNELDGCGTRSTLRYLLVPYGTYIPTEGIAIRYVRAPSLMDEDAHIPYIRYAGMFQAEQLNIPYVMYVSVSVLE